MDGRGRAEWVSRVRGLGLVLVTEGLVAGKHCNNKRGVSSKESDQRGSKWRPSGGFITAFIEIFIEMRGSSTYCLVRTLRLGPISTSSSSAVTSYVSPPDETVTRTGCFR